ncbi:MAG: hypothetical protein OXL96_07910 [Candidatus Poribacteria bacterium]|nr:hypothetical protein [Candidatus Poribacteria bacterium]
MTPFNGRSLSKQAEFGLQYPMQIKNNNRISDFDGGVLKRQKIENAMAQEG